MSSSCGNCDCADKTNCPKKGNSYGFVITETDGSYFHEVAENNPFTFMASSSKTPDPSLLRSKKLESELSNHKKQIQASRSLSIRDKIEKNMRNIQNHTRRFHDASEAAEAATNSMLLTRLGAPLCVLGGWESAAGMGEKEVVNVQEEMLAAGTVVFAASGGKTAVRFVKIPYVERIPSYTTWIFLDRNQRMAEDQSVVGRRRIYYDPYGNETLICSDSDEEIAVGDEMKHVFSDGEDQLLYKALKEHGKNQEVLNILTQLIEVPPSEIEERFELLVEKYQQRHVKDSEASAEEEFGGRQFLNKTLSASLDSFDNLFCRRCLIFDCRLHGCSQTLVVPSEKQSHGFEPEESRKPCSDQCYLKKKYSETLCDNISDATSIRAKECITSTKNLDNAEASKTQKPIDIADASTTTAEVPSENLGKRKVLKHENVPLRNTKSVVERLDSAYKKQKVSLPDSSLISNLDTNLVSLTNTEALDSGLPGADHFESKDTRELAICHGKEKDITKDGPITIKMPLVKKSSSSSKGKTAYGWNAIEKDLYLKGVEIFGKNSCLIARNLLSGLKSCMEVSNYMFSSSTALSRTRLSSLHLEDNGNSDHYLMEQGMPPPSRIWRRRGRARKLKYTWKSAGHPFLRKRIGDGKQQACKQYTPCECKLMCGKQCTCLQNGTCCEKYCGCSKSCKNRFRGCHCAKSQCRSRQCPCFAAGRECDPDVCRNCWVSCGDSSLGEPPIRGDGYQCGNMKLLLKQQQRILLGRSDVAGWGAFTKNPVNKNDYLGEYTGELISHKEADKRGKIYDRANSSFLFDLNDQFVLDAYRKGDKLKFANHSSNPNCYAKVMLVAGDHRVGIFAKEHIGASEELFYDYRYGPDQAPIWARKPGGSKRDDSSASHSRAQKIA